MRWLFASPAKIDHEEVVKAIQRAEEKTSGEIQVVVARHKAADPVVTAQAHFEKLGMTQTKNRNAILIFVAPRSRNFAVIGDRGIHEKCGNAFWEALAETLGKYFRKGEFTQGLVHAIERAGGLLAEHFPPTPGSGNELPDGVTEVD